MDIDLNNKMRERSKELIRFIKESPTAFHVVDNSVQLLLEKGFKELELGNEWNLNKGGKYFIKRNKSALIAFTIGKGELTEKGFKLIGAHTDSPSFRIKPNPEMLEEDRYLKLNTEVYGGPILNTWFDRPLSLAGRVSLKTDNPLNINSKLINLNDPLLIIPNLAIHMNRKVNEGVELNKQKDVLPLLGLVEEEFEKENFLIKLLADELEVEKEKIVDFDLFLYETNAGDLTGLNDEFISIGRQDDLAMAEAGLKAIANSKISEASNVLVLFDNEEVGSATKQGANSPMLSHLLERIVENLGGNRGSYFQALANSFIISADMAHAVHPNYSDEHDPTNRPVINKGPVLKINANQKYTSDSISGGVFASLCEKADIPYQKFVNRSDKKGGSTIGPISATQLGIDSVDIGNPLLAMHSIREFGGVKDHYYASKLFEEYYNI
ncbi:MAG: M18 family aminopeptidase [Bacillota bacterium]